MTPTGLRLLRGFFDGRTHSVVESGGSSRMLNQLEGEGLLRAERRNTGRGKARYNWSITQEGLQELLAAAQHGDTEPFDPDSLRDAAKTHRADAEKFSDCSDNSYASQKVAEVLAFLVRRSDLGASTSDDLIRRAEIYEAHLAQIDLEKHSSPPGP